MKNTQEKKVILITGAARGIGAAIARKLASPERVLYLHFGHSAKACERLQEELEQKGCAAYCLSADLLNPVACSEIIEKIKEKEGRIDGLVNNAGITKDNLLVRMKDQDYDEVIQVNQKAPFILMRAAAKIMMRQRSGSIVNISSIVGLKGNPGQINYAASKAALIAMSKSLAQELGSRGVRVNCVAPGFIETDMTADLGDQQIQNIITSIPLGRVGLPQDIANAVAFLLSQEASYITGQTLSVDGGMNQ